MILALRTGQVGNGVALDPSDSCQEEGELLALTGDWSKLLFVQ